jgi:catechol 2,3-dioxygenase-like lactoylglutathione lyase family enzyme
MITGIDHVVILVRDLAAAQADYAALGFTVVPGGEHAGGQTHNALVAFADGCYLELIAFKPDVDAASAARLPPLTQRWWARTVAGEGLLDFALLPGAIAEDVAAARERGLPLEGPFPGGRRRPDGQEIAWQTAISPTPDLPFLCGDVTPRELRVPGGAAQQHANGVQGVAGIVVGVNDVQASVTRYRALLGSAPRTNAGQGLPVFQVGNARIGLVALPEHRPSVQDTAEPADSSASHTMDAAAARRDEGPIRLLLGAAPGKAQGELDPRLTHGARIVVLDTNKMWRT